MDKKDESVKLDLLEDSNVRSYDQLADDVAASKVNPFAKDAFIGGEPNATPVETVEQATAFEVTSETKTTSETKAAPKEPPRPKPPLISVYNESDEEINSKARARQDRPKFEIGRWLKFAVAAVVIAGLAALAVVIINGQGTITKQPVLINNFETVSSLGQAMQDVPVKTEFNEGDPLAFRFNYDEAEVGTVVSFEVANQKTDQLVRDGTVEALRDEDSISASGQRFVSVVSQSMTKLPAGDYVIRLFVDGSEIAQHEFTVKATE
jgi:hypothetical protein